MTELVQGDTDKDRKNEGLLDERHPKPQRGNGPQPEKEHQQQEADVDPNRDTANGRQVE